MSLCSPRPVKDGFSGEPSVSAPGDDPFVEYRTVRYAPYKPKGKPSMPVNLVSRQHIQRERIQQGVETGQMTKREAVNAGRALSQVHQSILADRWDGGGLTRQEAAKSHLNLNDVSRDIFRMKHN